MQVVEIKNRTIIYEDTTEDFLRDRGLKFFNNEVNEYLQENVLLFNEDKLLIDDKTINNFIAERVMGKLADGKTFLLKVESDFDMSDPYCFEEKHQGDYIENGYMQIINIIYGIKTNSEKSVIAIPIPENHLHFLVVRHLIEYLEYAYTNKMFIIYTRSKDIYKYYLNYKILGRKRWN